MRIPYHLLRSSTFRSEPLLAAMAAVAVGMFVGAWLIGPAITHRVDTTTQTAAVTSDHPSFEDMVARPDPSPYRAATPAFDTNNAPNYAAAAKEKAQAELSGEISEDAALEQQQPGVSRRRAYYPTYDRHHVY
jgi:hypothetical protein